MNDCILLFDIDGTLISKNGNKASAGQRAMSIAAEMMTGVANLADNIVFAGATDLDVARQLLEMGGVALPSDTQKQTLLSHYVDNMKELIKTDSYVALGDAKNIVRQLKQRGYIIGLGTGNVKEGAFEKLKSVGLEKVFDIDLGGYGEDGENRAEILNIAVNRCSQTGEETVIVIGDTHKDVYAAIEIGAKCIGVPFGKSTNESLRDAGAHAVVDCIDSQLIRVIHQLMT